VAAQGLGVVLDSHGGGLGGAEGVDAEQVSQRAVVDAEGLSDLEEPNQLEPAGSGQVGIGVRGQVVVGAVVVDE
jgi:hypothetical protein